MQCFCIGCAALGYPSQHLNVTSNGQDVSVMGSNHGSCYLEVQREGLIGMFHKLGQIQQSLEDICWHGFLRFECHFY